MRSIILFVCFSLPFSLLAQAKYWQEVSVSNKIEHSALQFDLDLGALEYYTNKRAKKNILLPLPNGSFELYDLLPSRVMSEALQAKFPKIQTFIGYNEAKNYKIYLGWSPSGFYAMGQSEMGYFHIDQVKDSRYNVYYHHNFEGKNHLAKACLTNTKILQTRERNQSRRSRGGEDVEMKNYRLAVATTGEYSTFHGTSKTEVMSAIVATFNKVNLIYNNDLAINLELVANNEDIIFLDKDTDPFTEGNANMLISQCQNELDATIGVANYDIGHVLGKSNAGGLAFQGAVCINGLKGRGYSGSIAPVADAFNVDYVSHEIGHQFGGSHTWAYCSGGSDAPTKSVEPGSGSTIMGYAGLCSSSDIQVNSDPYFHSITIEEIFAYIEDDISSCHTTSGTVNTNPTVSVRASGFSIPIETPFELIAAATDNEDFDLSYCWEQTDVGASTPLGNPSGSSASFRSFPPDNNPVRSFPRLSILLNNTTGDIFEILPDYTRDLNFRLTVRDNNIDAGGIAYEDVSFNADANAGPFLVLTPNTSGVIWEENGIYEVTWDIANTDQSPVNCAHVDIYLSRDGGLTFPVLLADDTPNDGSECITVPLGMTDDARIKIKASDNIFFDVSNQNFRIDMGTSSIDPDLNSASVVLSPNPALSYSSLSFEFFENERAQVNIYNIAGQILLSEQILTTDDFVFDTTVFSAGVYWVDVWTDKFRFRKKLVKL